jgi:hypothetical protein
MVKGEGSYVVYDDGRRMLDFTCGIGVTNLGKWVLMAMRANVGRMFVRTVNGALDWSLAVGAVKIRDVVDFIRHFYVLGLFWLQLLFVHHVEGNLSF